MTWTLPLLGSGRFVGDAGVGTPRPAGCEEGRGKGLQTRRASLLGLACLCWLFCVGWSSGSLEVLTAMHLLSSRLDTLGLPMSYVLLQCEAVGPTREWLKLAGAAV